MFFLSRKFGALVDQARPAPVHGRRAARRGDGPAALPARRRPGGLRHRNTSAAPALRARAVDDGGAAHLGGARGSRSVAGRDRIRRQQRDREGRRSARDGRRRSRRGGGVRLLAGQRTAGDAARPAPRAGPSRRQSACRSGAPTSRGCRRARPMPCRLPPSMHRSTASTSAWRSRRRWSPVGGLIGAAGIRDPRFRGSALSRLPQSCPSAPPRPDEPGRQGEVPDRLSRR